MGHEKHYFFSFNLKIFYSNRNLVLILKSIFNVDECILFNLEFLVEIRIKLTTLFILNDFKILFL